MAGADPAPTQARGERFAHPVVLAVLVASAAIALAGRFFVDSPLWLDEALSVNIAKLPPGDIVDALRHDGHPPLYYVLLHGWMALFGEGDRAVRALSGLITILTVPLAYLTGRQIAGRRLGITTAVVFVLSPYAFRYGSETRMYALVMAEVFAGHLFVTAALRRPRPISLAGTAAVTGLMLWTHYWSMWLIGAVGMLLLGTVVTARRRGDTARSSTALKVIGAIVAGGLTFLPWLPTLQYQSEHTGTPWAPPFRLATLAIQSLTEFAGGAYSEAQVGMLITTVLITIGIFGTGLDDRRIELDFRTHALARRPLTVTALTVAIAFAVSLVNGMAFAPRYAAVFFPLVVLLVALGVDQFRGGRVRDVLLVVLALVALAGILFVVRLDRSQAQVAADAIEAGAPRALVIACPDQLGPSISRVLDRDRYEVLTYPRFEAPERVDWVDYEQRNSGNDPEGFAGEVLRRAGDRPVYVVFRDDFLTLEGQCQRVVDTLAANRRPRSIRMPPPERYYETMNVVELLPL